LGGTIPDGGLLKMSETEGKLRRVVSTPDRPGPSSDNREKVKNLEAKGMTLAMSQIATKFKMGK